MLKELLNEILLTESATADEVISALDNHYRVIINYHSDGKDIASGARVIEVYAYGLTKAGNPVIRAFQPFGDTTSSVPSWKFFRLDRISKWEPTEQKFSNPASDRYPGLPKFNETDDKTMSIVYKIADFDSETPPYVSDKRKEELFKTNTQTGFERLKQQLDHPITLADLQKASQKEPQVQKQEPEPVQEPKSDVYKTPTERGLSDLQKKLANARKIDLSQFEKPKEKSDSDKDKKSEKDKERVERVKDLIQKQDKIKMSDLNKAIEEPVEEPQKDDTYTTDTERGMSNLLNQLKNPTKIDLSKIPKK